MKKEKGTNAVLKTWEKIPTLFRAIFTGFLVSTFGIAIWTIMLFLILPPLSILPMIFVLWVYWKFFSGGWGKGIIAVINQENFRRVKLSSESWKWGLIAAIFFVVIVQASFVITFRLREFPATQFTSDYKMLDKMPQWIAWSMLIMSSVVAGICEETGYRGYLQAPVEKRYGPVPAIVITSIIFTLIHLSKSWAYSILPHIFFASVLLGILAYKSGSLIPGIIGHSILDIFNYSFWWTGMEGGFKKQTIFITGIDLHIVVWVIVFILALFIFFRSVANLKPQKRPVN